MKQTLDYLVTRIERPRAIGDASMNLKVSVLGAGSFGTTIAHVISGNTPTLLGADARRPPRRSIASI